MASLYKRKKKGGKHTWYITHRQNGQFKMISTKTGDKKLAEELLRRFEADLVRIEQGLPARRKMKSTMLSDFIELYLADREKINRAKNTILVDRASFRNFMAYVGDVNLQTITPKLVRQYREHRSQKASIATVNMELQHLKTAFFWAMDCSSERYLAVNPFKQKELFLKDEEEYVPRCLTPPEKVAFFNTIDDPDHKRLMSFYLLTGCRRNEALNLDWDDNNMENRQILFRKTRAGKIRIIPIGIELMQIVMSLDRNAPKPFPFTPNHATHLFKKYVRNAGLKEDLYLRRHV